MRPLLCILLLALATIAWAAPGRQPAAVARPSSPASHQRIACPNPVARPARAVAAVRNGSERVLIESGVDQAGQNGRLTLRAMSASGDGISLGDSPLWDASALLTGPPPRPAPQERKIFTLVRRADGSTASVPFTWDQLGQEERAWLDAARVGFLRGEREREIGQPDGIFRRRTGILGDVIHSTPLLVGAPSTGVQGAGYDAFHARYQARAEAIYVGASDGMLHAFDARDGAELFAYVPNALLPVVGQLADPDYQQRPYVDGSAGQAEALLDGRWRSVLVAGMGMGARGVFALDVSDPGAFGDGERALWEFTERDDPDVRYVSAPPLVAKIRVGVKGSATQYRYFAIVPGGAGAPAQTPANTDGALFLLALDKPAAERWQQGVNYYKLAAPASIPDQPNALGQPALAFAQDGSARYAYAGDLQGALWRFDFSGKPPFASARWFEARDDRGQRQSITQAPRTVVAPGGGYLVLFGTGKSIEDDGAAYFAPQSFYAVLDTAATPVETVRGRAELARRTLAGDAAYTIAGDEFDYGGEGAKKGWYFDFANARIDGERIAASPVVAAGAVFVNTTVPGADPCAAPSMRTYVLDTLTGFIQPAAGTTTGRLVKGSGMVPLLLQLGVVSGARNATGGVVATRSIGIVNLQEKGAPALQRIEVGAPAGRISWREVANWQELHQAAKK